MHQPVQRHTSKILDLPKQAGHIQALPLLPPNHLVLEPEVWGVTYLIPKLSLFLSPMVECLVPENSDNLSLLLLNAVTQSSCHPGSNLLFLALASLLLKEVLYAVQFHNQSPLQYI